MNSEIYKTLQTSYLRKTGIKQGDIVKIVHTSGSFDFGWKNSWDGFMKQDSLLSVVKANDGEKGVLLSDKRHYPFFVLEKVDNAVSITVGNHSFIKLDGNVFVNGKSISIQDLKSIKDVL